MLVSSDEGTVRKEHITVEIDGQQIGQDVFVDEETGLDIDDHSGAFRTREETEAFVREVYRVGRDSMPSELERYNKWVQSAHQQAATPTAGAADRQNNAAPQSIDMVRGRPRRAEVLSKRAEDKTTNKLSLSSSLERSGAGTAAAGTVEDRIVAAEKFKTDANARLSAGDPRHALRLYNRALDVLLRPGPSSSADVVVDGGSSRGQAGESAHAAQQRRDEDSGGGGSSAKRSTAAVDALHVTLLSNKAAALLQLHRYYAAMDACLEALAIQPMHLKCLYRLGVSYAATGQLRRYARIVERLTDSGDGGAACKQQLLDACAAFVDVEKRPILDWTAAAQQPQPYSASTEQRSLLVPFRRDVDSGTVVGSLLVLRIPLHAWFTATRCAVAGASSSSASLSSSAAAGSSETVEELLLASSSPIAGMATARRRTSFTPKIEEEDPAVMVTPAFVSAFTDGENDAGKTLRAFLSFLGACPQPCASVRNIARLTSMRKVFRLVHPTPEGAAQKNNASENGAATMNTASEDVRREQHRQRELFAMLIAAACVLGYLDGEETAEEEANDNAGHDVTMPGWREPLLRMPPGRATATAAAAAAASSPSDDLPTEDDGQFVVCLGLGRLLMRSADRPTEDCTPRHEVTMVGGNCRVDALSGVVTTTTDVDVGSACCVGSVLIDGLEQTMVRYLR